MLPYLSTYLLQRTQAITITITISIARVPNTDSNMIVRSTKEDKKEKVQLVNYK